MNRSLVMAAACAAAIAHVPAVSRAQGALPTWRATEVWRIDGTESGEPFFDLRDYLVHRDGVVWVLENKDQMIRRFDQAGKELPSVGRKGSGPGEMSNANGFVMRRDGSVWVNDPRNSRFTVFSGDGKFVRQHAWSIPSWGYRWTGWIDRSTGDLIDPFTNRRGTTSIAEWRRVSADGAIRDTMSIPTCSTPGAPPPYVSFRAETKDKGMMVSAYPFTTGGGSAPDGDGGMWCALAGSMRVVRVRIGANDTTAQTSVTLAPVPITKVERDSAIARAQKQVAQYATNTFDASKIPNAKPAIASLTVDDDGRLWVQHAERFGEASVTFDIHDKTGKHLGRLRIPQRPSATGLPIRARGNDLWIAVRDEDDVIGIARYRIAR
jgi:hypothetical protein